MIKTQRIIKYFAIAFALLLTFNIISMIMYGIASLGHVFNINNNDNNITEKLETLEVATNVKNLDIDVTSVNILVKEGTSLKIETNNENIKYKESNNKISIVEQKHNWLNNNSSELIIYIPSDYLFDNVSIEGGAGKIQIELLNTKKLDLELGAGKVDIKNLKVITEAEIEGGAGEVSITDASISNLDLDMGVGKLTLSATLNGNNKINAGIGEVTLDLIGNEENYKIKINESIGKVTLNGENMTADTYYGNGSNLIDINGGIGHIEINYSR